MPLTQKDRDEAAKAGMQTQTPQEPPTSKDKLPRGRILTMDDGMMRIHPDDMGPVYPDLAFLRANYAPSLEEFEKKFGALSADSPTRQIYTEKPAQTPVPEKK